MLGTLGFRVCSAAPTHPRRGGSGAIFQWRLAGVQQTTLLHAARQRARPLSQHHRQHEHHEEQHARSVSRQVAGLTATRAGGPPRTEFGSHARTSTLQMRKHPQTFRPPRPVNLARRTPQPDVRYFAKTLNRWPTYERTTHDSVKSRHKKKAARRLPSNKSVTSEVGIQPSRRDLGLALYRPNPLMRNPTFLEPLADSALRDTDPLRKLGLRIGRPRQPARQLPGLMFRHFTHRLAILAGLIPNCNSPANSVYAPTR